jgi:AraC-like DNA-binding protein
MRNSSKSITTFNTASSHAVAVPSEPQRLNEEPHYTVKEVAAMLKLSPDSIRRLFRNEPGVLALGSVGRRGKRPYVSLRIPQSVFERKYRQITLG